MCSLSTIVAMIAGGVAATSVLGQEQVTYHWSFVEIEANTTNLATGPLAGNGMIDPGEGVELRLSLSFTPEVGSPIGYTPPPGSGTGIVGGLASISFALRTPPGHNGVFHNITRAGPWALGGVGTIGANSVEGASAGQFPLPGQIANPANPIENIWRIRWTPTDYTNRVVQFTAQKAISTPSTGAALYVDYNNDPGNPAYVSKFVQAHFGGIGIIIVPSPTGLALLGLGGLFAARRRR